MFSIWYPYGIPPGNLMARSIEIEIAGDKKNKLKLLDISNNICRKIKTEVDVATFTKDNKYSN